MEYPYIYNTDIENVSVRNIHYDIGTLYGNVGTFVNETKYDNDFMERADDGVYIYQSKYDDMKALRIYKEFNNYNFNSFVDKRLIPELIRRQEGIYLTDLPTGIVTLDERIIGQEIVYYQNGIELRDVLKDKEFKKIIPTDIYLKVLKIIKELAENGIHYLDIHNRNFLVTDKRNLELKLIDFDSNYIRIVDKNAPDNLGMIENFKFFVESCNDLLGLDRYYFEFDRCNSLDEINESLITSDKVLRKVI